MCGHGFGVSDLFMRTSTASRKASAHSRSIVVLNTKEWIAEFPFRIQIEKIRQGENDNGIYQGRRSILDSRSSDRAVMKRLQAAIDETKIRFVRRRLLQFEVTAFFRLQARRAYE